MKDSIDRYEQVALELQYRSKLLEVQRTVRRDKREFAIVLVREVGDSDGLVKDVNGRLLIHDAEQLKR